jgi:hypothetical protein
MRADGGPDTELVVAGGPDAAELDGDPEVERLRAVARRAGVATAWSSAAGSAGTSCPRCSARPTSRSASPGTSRSASSARGDGLRRAGDRLGGRRPDRHGRARPDGLHVPPRRPDVLAEQLAELLGDDERRAALGRAGARRARAKYSWDRVAAQTLHTYADLLPLPLSAMIDQEVSS